MQKSIQLAMILHCALFFYLHSIYKQKEAGVWGKPIYPLENYCYFA